MILRRRKKKSLDYNNSFLGEYECSSLALDRDERRGEESRNEKEEIRSLKTKSNNVTDQEISKRVRSGNDFECTYNNDKSLSEIQLEHWRLRLKSLKEEKFGGAFEQTLKMKVKRSKEDEESDDELKSFDLK
ncbi:hypothetical protein Tco_0351492 [Tanacetum coccineum]